ncbi:MAG: zinc ribbon domain-containing protein [Acinetobacter sp.]
MALINCPECSKQISDQSTTCPHCGYPIQARKVDTWSTHQAPREPEKKKAKSYGCGTFILLVVIGFIVYQCASSYSDYQERVQKHSEPPAEQTTKSIDLETKASTMLNTYEQNEVRADAIYKGKVLKVTGIVHSISSDLNDDAVVHLAPKGDEYAFTSVHAHGDRNFHNQAINLTKGTMITIICIGDGEIIGSPQLKDCSFISK